MQDLILRQRQNVNLVLDDRVITTFTEAVSGEVFYRFADEPDAEPRFLTEVVAGKTAKVPFDFKYKPGIQLFLISKSVNKSSSTRAVEGAQAFFNPNTETSVPLI